MIDSLRDLECLLFGEVTERPPAMDLAVDALTDVLAEGAYGGDPADPLDAGGILRGALAVFERPACSIALQRIARLAWTVALFLERPAVPPAASDSAVTRRQVGVRSRDGAWIVQPDAAEPAPAIDWAFIGDAQRMLSLPVIAASELGGGARCWLQLPVGALVEVCAPQSTDRRIGVAQIGEGVHA